MHANGYEGVFGEEKKEESLHGRRRKVVGNVLGGAEKSDVWLVLAKVAETWRL
jgi:hypothetical protein